MGLVLFPTSILWDSGYFECPQTGIVLNSCVHSTGSILGVEGSKKEQKGVKGSKKDLSSLLDSVILYVVSLGDDPSSFSYPGPAENCRGVIFMWSSMVTSNAKKIAGVTLL